MKYNYNKLRGRIVEKFLNIKNFSEKLDISYEAVSKKLNNFISFSQEDITKWCDLLDILPEEIGVYFFTLEVQTD